MGTNYHTNASGTITDQGKFEGQQSYVQRLWDSARGFGCHDWERVLTPRLWNSAIDGMHSDTIYTDGNVDTEIFLKSDFPGPYNIPVDCYAVAIWQSDDGFVSSRVFETEAELRSPRHFFDSHLYFLTTDSRIKQGGSHND